MPPFLLPDRRLDQRRCKAGGLALLGILLGILLTGFSSSALAEPAATRPKAPKPAATLQQTVDAANRHADRENYPEAIRLYEEALRQAPNEGVLKNNLAVLYFNQGVALQRQKRYDEANALFDRSLTLSPKEDSPREAKAAGFYLQALDLKETLKQSGSADPHPVQALLQQAININPQEMAYKKALASSYLGEARELAVQEQYLPAAALLEKALALDPEAPALRQSLANVYLGQASRFADDKAERQLWLDKALTLDASEAMKAKVKDIESGRLGYGSSPSGDTPGAKTPTGTAHWSVQDKVTAIEKALGIAENAEIPLITRLETVEKQVYGKAAKNESGKPVGERADKLFAVLLGTGQTVADSVPNLVQAAVQNTENTYLDRIFQYTDGRVVRWARFPIRVYVEPPDEGLENRALYREEFEQTVLEGLDAWKTATNGFVSYVTVKNPLAADIRIVWEDAYPDRFADPAAMADNPLKRYTPPSRTSKSSKAAQAIGLASMLTPGLFSLAPQAVAAGMQYREARKLAVLEEESRIVLGLDVLRDKSPEAARLLVRNLAAYEFGHALGLKGTSADPADLLYPGGLRFEKPLTPSPRDLATLRELYSRPANIVLNVK